MEENCEDDIWFEPNIIYTPDQPSGFQEWSEDITYWHYNINLPDGTVHDAKLFIDFNRRFKDQEYTNYIVNRYKDINNEL